MAVRHASSALKSPVSLLSFVFVVGTGFFTFERDGGELCDERVVFVGGGGRSFVILVFIQQHWWHHQCDAGASHEWFVCDVVCGGRHRSRERGVVAGAGCNGDPAVVECAGGVVVCEREFVQRVFWVADGRARDAEHS